MKLREIRIREGRQQKELGRAIGTDEPMMSRFENYKCLPTPQMMEKLLKELNCSIEYIYEPHEIYLQVKKTARPANEDKPERERRYHLSVRLPPEEKDFFKLALKECGYKDITDWVSRCLDSLKEQYANKKRLHPRHQAKVKS